jgi:Tol biopolymer transport system component
MKTIRHLTFALAAITLAHIHVVPPVAAQELSAEGKSKEVAEAKAKRDALNFQNNATTIAFFDRTFKRTGGVGERAIYDEVVLSPDGSRVAVCLEDLANESADLFVLDAKTGAKTRLTTSARTEFVMAPVWSPDGSRIAYVTIRKGQEGIYTRAANGQGGEELLYKNPGAFMNLTDWSQDGRFLTFAISDLKGGALYLLPVNGSADRKPVEITHSDLRMFSPRFSPDGRFLSYTVVDQSNRSEVFVRPIDAATKKGPWQVSDGSSGMAFWRRDGKELYYPARDQSMMVAEVSTSPEFSFTKPKVLFRQQAPVPERVTYISSDGERFLVLPRPRGPQLQQVTIFDRKGEVVRKVGAPGLYGQPSFSPDGRRLLITKADLATGQADLWTIELANGKTTRLTNDTLPKNGPLWSPDGKYIYFTSLRNGDWPVLRRPSDGTGNEELVFRYTPGAGLNVTDISPDGKFIVCDSGGVILLVPLTGDPASRQATEYLRDEFTDNVGRLSPDGKFLAFRSDEAQPERGEVYVRPFDASTNKPGTVKWRVSKDGVLAMVHWRADGKEIFFRGLNLESNELRVMSVDVTTTPTFTVGSPKLLFKLPGPLGGNLGNISRDGQQFVFAVNVPAGETK